jgi:hypothetical protein
MGWGPPKSEALGSHPASPPFKTGPAPPQAPRLRVRTHTVGTGSLATTPPRQTQTRPHSSSARRHSAAAHFQRGAVPSSWPGRSGLEDEGCSPLMSVSWPSRSQRHRYGLPLNKKGTMETRSKQNRRHAFDFVSRITL